MTNAKTPDPLSQPSPPKRKKPASEKDAHLEREANAHAAGFRVGLEHRDLEHAWIADWLATLPDGESLRKRFLKGEWRPSNAPPKP